MISQHSRPGERLDPYSAASRFWTDLVGCKGALCAVPTISLLNIFGGHASFSPPYEVVAPPPNLPGDVLLHPVGHLDQPPPRLLEERHHAIHVAVARQRNLDLALAFGCLRLG